MKTLRRVLVVQPYGIGDLLFITPVLRALRLIPTVERVDLLLGSRNAVVVRANPHVDEIMEVDKDLYHRQGKMKTFRDAFLLGQKIRSRQYDLLLDYSLRSEYAFFSQFFLGIPKRAGFDYKRRGFFHTHRLPLQKGFSGRHVADFSCGLAELAGVPVRDRWLEFYLENEDVRQVRQILLSGDARDWKRFAVVSAGGGESWGRDAHFKRWPPGFFAKFLKRIQRKAGLDGVFLVGGPGEKELAAALQAAMEIPSVNLTGQLTLSQTACVIDRSSLFVGNDGGLLHLACARRKPVIGFYGPVDPAVYGPYPLNLPFTQTVVKENLECRPCYQKFRYKSDCPDRRCLTELTPEEADAFLEARNYFNNFYEHGVQSSAAL